MQKLSCALIIFALLMWEYPQTGITPDIVVKFEPKNGAKTHPVYREKDLEKHLENDTSKEPARKDEMIEQEQEVPDKDVTEETPAQIDDKDDNQLQRAVDLLKGWKILKELPKAG